jgi:transcriptional regulator with PAS, ATPase and Fis domain
VLQDNQFMMLGSNKAIRIDTRIIAATNQNLEELIKQKRFREDLYHRLNVVNIHIPPLKERKEDIEPLTKHFLKEFAETYNKRITSISPKALNLLKLYDWPGNVRELKNVIEKLVVYSSTQQISAQSVRRVLFNGNTNTSSVRIPGKTLKEKLLQFERMPILEALKEAGSKIGKAAQLLGIDRSALFGKKRKHRIIQLLRR